MSVTDLRHRTYSNTVSAGTPAEFILEDDAGRRLNIEGTDWTYNPHYAWQGTREQMHRILERVPEGLRRTLRPRQVTFPRPAGRA